MEAKPYDMENTKRLHKRLCSSPSLNGNLLRSRSSSLGHQNRQNTILQAGLNIILVNPVREREGARELANSTLTSPVAVTSLGGRLRRLLRSLDGLLLVAVAGLLLWRWGVVLALGATFHDQSLGVGEFNVDVLLGDTGEFAVQVEGCLALADVEARREAAQAGLAVVAVVVVVVQKAEEGGEVACRWEGGSEERHCGFALRLFGEEASG